MARKTFVSYKYSEAQGLRDDILEALGEDSIYYQGETSESPDLTDTTTENIREKLKNMIYGTSVTIVVISPNIKQSNWIDWEIEYSLKEISREDRTSRSNGILGIIMKVNNSYDWIVTKNIKEDGCHPRSIDDDKLYIIISENRYNLKEKVYSCNRCRTVDVLNGSYISLIKEDDFLNDPSLYIENALEKSEKIERFDILKIR